MKSKSKTLMMVKSHTN